MKTINVDNLSVEKTVAEISEYLTTGFHHSTPEAQQKIAQIITKRLFPTVFKCHEILHGLRTSRATSRDWKSKIPPYYQEHFRLIEKQLNPNVSTHRDS